METSHSNFIRFRQVFFPLAVVLVSFCMPWIRKGIQFPIAISVIAWFFYPKEFKKQSFKIFILFSGIYFFHLIAMLYTENLPRGMRDLMQKLSLILFPLLLAFVKPFEDRLRRLILPAFVLGLVVSLIISFTTSISAFRETGELTELYMSQFSTFHPSYLAMFMVWSVGILLWYLSYNKFRPVINLAIWVLIGLFSVCLVFPASKMGFLSFGFTVVFFLGLWFYQKQLKTWKTIILLGISFLTFLTISYNPIASNRVRAAVEYVNEDGATPQKENPTESNSARGFALKIAFEEIQKYHLLGTGTGDINDVLMARFREEGLPELAAKELNPHNEFIQIALAQGLIAAAWFIFAFFYPLKRAFKRKETLYIFFIGLMFMNFMVEAMLEKQTGVIFYAFFNSLFYFILIPKEE